MVKAISIDALTKIHVDAAYTTGEREVKDAISEFASSRRWSVFFGVVTGLAIGAYIIAAVYTVPSLSTHTWIVIGTGGVISGLGIILFAITTTKAVKDYKTKDNFLTGLKEYYLSAFAHGKLIESNDYSSQERSDFVLGIQGEDMNIFLKYLDEEVLGKIIPQINQQTAEERENCVHDLAQFIRLRPDWERELEDAGYDETLLQRLERYIFPVKTEPYYYG